MSWDKTEKDCKCPCGKGTYTEYCEMDDWNRTRYSYVMNCPECKEKYYYSTDQIGNKPHHFRDKGRTLKDNGGK